MVTEKGDGVVYGIFDPWGQCIYIGSTLGFERRKNAHLTQLKNGTHPNKPMQNYINELYHTEKPVFDWETEPLKIEPLAVLNQDVELVMWALEPKRLEQAFIKALKPKFNRVRSFGRRG